MIEDDSSLGLRRAESSHLGSISTGSSCADGQLGEARVIWIPTLRNVTCSDPKTPTFLCSRDHIFGILDATAPAVH